MGVNKFADKRANKFVNSLMNVSKKNLGLDGDLKPIPCSRLYDCCCVILPEYQMQQIEASQGKTRLQKLFPEIGIRFATYVPGECQGKV